MARPRPAGGPRRAARRRREAAAIDLTGYWVSVIVEDWKWRMVTPKKGVYEAIPLNAEGRKVGETLGPGARRGAGEQCRSYGAANIMRVPGRLHITWENDNTLRVDTDAGTQTRLFHFGAPPPAGEPSWQGHSRGAMGIRTGTRARARSAWRQSEGRDDQPAPRLRAQERRAVQRRAPS